jgi:hypothetical protein
MRKSEIESLLEAAVAKALGVSLPVHHRRTSKPAKRMTTHRHAIKRAA